MEVEKVCQIKHEGVCIDNEFEILTNGDLHVIKDGWNRVGVISSNGNRLEDKQSIIFYP